MSKKTIYTCYGCKYYYRTNDNGEREYLKPFSYRHCDIEHPMECDYVVNDGEPNKRIAEQEGKV